MPLRERTTAQTERQDGFGCLLWGQFDHIHVRGGSVQPIELDDNEPTDAIQTYWRV
jgi:hypothetical protein